MSVPIKSMTFAVASIAVLCVVLGMSIARDGDEVAYYRLVAFPFILVLLAAHIAAFIAAQDAAGGGPEPATEELAMLVADDEGKAESEVRGRPIFPFGAQSIGALSGATVEILRMDEEGPVLVLSGTVPEINAPEPDRGEPPPEPVERLEFETVLERPEAGHDDDANGKVEWEEQDDEHEIEIEVEDLVPEANYSVVLTNAAGDSEALFNGAADVRGDIRDKRVVFTGEPLPFGVQSLRELDGSTVTVLDADGATVLVGDVIVPAAAMRQVKAVAVHITQVLFSTVGHYDSWFVRGDVNEDSFVDTADVVASLEFLFLASEAPLCLDTMDMNDDSSLDIGDPVYGLIYLFRGGREPPYPGPNISGYDPTPDDLFCEDA